MKITRSPKNLQVEINKLKADKKSVGFVATMGALHEGHLSLIRRCRKDNDITVVSIFVNLKQFGPKEDFKRYPRPRAKDIALCKKAGVDILFYPDCSSMYPAGYKTYVEVEGLSNVLCGASRPKHFRGVATVVVKLLNIVSPGKAYFGQKDAQQAIIIKRIVSDLNIPVEIKVMPTLRHPDGLAMSSRNAYLSPLERKDALVLHEALALGKKIVRSGTRDAARVISLLRKLINSKKTAKIDYVAVVDQLNLKPVSKITDGCLLAVAVKIGKTRLIDNTII